MTSAFQLGEYTVYELLGEGGSAVVYRAELYGEECALKVLHPSVELTDRETERFLEEADRLRLVRHRSLVSVKRAGILPDGRPYLAMPRLVGRTLADQIGGKPLPLLQAISLFEGLASAVAALHELGLVHRDIKPENVFYLEREERLILLDLGIARDVDAMPSTTTRAGMSRGTPAYMAPERFFGRPASIATDVYELAVVLYVMLVGRLPWPADDPRGRVSPQPPSSHGVLVPAALATAILRALAHDFEQRPQTVAELLADVRAATAKALGEGMTPTIAQPTPPARAGARPDITTSAGPDVASVAPTLRAASGSSAPAPHALEGPSLTKGGVVRNADAVATGDVRGGAGRRSWVLTAAALVLAGGGVAIGFAWSRGSSSSDASSSGAAGPASNRTPNLTAAPSASAPTTAQIASAVPVSSSTSTPIASATASTSATASATTAPGTPSSSVVPAPGGGPDPPECALLLKTFCTPGGGGTPFECTTWRSNVDRWKVQLPSDIAAQTCSAARTASLSGLEERKKSGGPPGAPATPTEPP